MFVIWNIQKARPVSAPMPWAEACAIAKDHHIVVPA